MLGGGSTIGTFINPENEGATTNQIREEPDKTSKSETGHKSQLHVAYIVLYNGNHVWLATKNPACLDIDLYLIASH